MEETNYNKEYKVNPFENIGLAFSGGGFRAASFALGVMSFLYEVDAISDTSENKKMLEYVTYISSASGGTITAMQYAYDIANGKSFNDFYAGLFKNLEGTVLLENALEKLNNKSNWDKKSPKKRNLINAFAKAYNEQLFNGHLVKKLTNTSSKSHLEEVCFNATEFYRGLSFRQAIKLKNDTKPDITFVYGNFIINLDKAEVDNLKLGDILAASSCFPAGFEPIVFPNDFVDNDNEKQKILKALKIVPQELSREELGYLYGDDVVSKRINIKPNESTKDLQDSILTGSYTLRSDFAIGLMDGGIADNQGLESLMRANERREAGKTSFAPFDLMLINDVGSHYMDAYKPNTKKDNNGISLNKLAVIMLLSLLAMVASIVYFKFYSQVLLTALLVIPIFILAVGVLAIGQIKKRIASKNEYRVGLNLDKLFSTSIIKLLQGYFTKTPINTIVGMLKERGKSVLTLNNDVFLKRVRQLLYQRFFSDNDWKLRKKSNHVYDLSFTNDVNRINNDKNKYSLSLAMQVIAEKAYEMGTTLWFDKNNTKEDTRAYLIACGQFTTCYNLLLYIDELKANDSIYNGTSKDKIDKLEIQLVKHYNYFINNSFGYIIK